MTVVPGGGVDQRRATNCGFDGMECVIAAVAPFFGCVTPQTLETGGGITAAVYAASARFRAERNGTLIAEPVNLDHWREH